MTEGREAKRLGQKQDKKPVHDVKPDETVQHSRENATEVIYLPKNDAQAAYDALMAAINAEGSRWR